MAESFNFDRETAVEQLGDGLWRGHIHSSWNIGDNPNGGYLVSVITSALSQVLPHPDPITVTTHFLRPGVPDADCDIKVEVIRTGRTLSTARASLIQEGKTRLEVLAGFGDLSVSAGRDAPLTIPPSALPPPDQCIARSGETQGVVLPILGRLDTRLHPDHARAGQLPVAEISGWNRFVDDRPPDTRSLLLFTDTFPPSPFSMLGVIGWVPTIELTVHVRRRPAPGWIQARLHCEDLHQGRMVESGALWDSNGDLVAQCRQIGLVMDRN
jgi:acyl-CoA thioesterase